jgi:hypothetical protein
MLPFVTHPKYSNCAQRNCLLLLDEGLRLHKQDTSCLAVLENRLFSMHSAKPSFVRAGELKVHHAQQNALHSASVTRQSNL